jgi:hypothetical protein
VCQNDAHHVRFNAEGIDGLDDRPARPENHGHPTKRMSIKIIGYQNPVSLAVSLQSPLASLPVVTSHFSIKFGMIHTLIRGLFKQFMTRFLIQLVAIPH